jgi:hypothetical protein
MSVLKFLFLLYYYLVKLQALSEADGSGAEKFLNNHSQWVWVVRQRNAHGD